MNNLRPYREQYPDIIRVGICCVFEGVSFNLKGWKSLRKGKNFWNLDEKHPAWKCLWEQACGPRKCPETKARDP